MERQDRPSTPTASTTVTNGAGRTLGPEGVAALLEHVLQLQLRPGRQTEERVDDLGVPHGLGLAHELLERPPHVGLVEVLLDPQRRRPGVGQPPGDDVGLHPEAE